MALPRCTLVFALALPFLSACASSPPKPSTRADLNCTNLQDAAGSTALGDFLEVACGCGAGKACELMALALRKEGGPANLEAAAQYLAKACRLGVPTACDGRPQDGTPAQVNGGSARP